MNRIKYLIFKELNANAGETLMVGDDVRDDVLGAQRVDSEIHKQFYFISLLEVHPLLWLVCLSYFSLAAGRYNSMHLSEHSILLRLACVGPSLKLENINQEMNQSNNKSNILLNI